MIFNLRPLKYEDYNEILVGWWKDWDWTPPPRDFLPEEGKGGIMVLDKDIPVCAGYIYNTNSKVAWVDWIISNKEYIHKENKKEALKLLIDTLNNMCKEIGSEYAYALLKHEGLIKTYEELGYKRADSYTVEMIKKI
tara:strand:+ start:129 stop:539 length:411 start_codon:yes stop_codon:yes gene_type:complete